MFADAVFHTQSLFTGLQQKPHPGSFAVAQGRIIQVSADDDLEGLVGPSTRTVDFGNGSVCPGLHDSHMHFFHSALYSSPLALCICGENEQDCVNALGDLAARRPAGSWLLSQGWREAHWNPPVLPSKRSLDAAFPNRPVAMYSGDAHTLWLNSCAMHELGIYENSQAPAGGEYQRDTTGQLTGIIREAAAMVLMPKIVAAFNDAEIEDAYSALLQRMLSLGITSLCDMSLMAAPGLDFVRDDIFQNLLDQERLPLRVNLFPTLLEDTSRIEKMRLAYTGDKLCVGGYKQFFDGVSSQHTAWLKEPYTNARFEGDCGRPTIEPERMRSLVLAAHQAGEAVRIHVIGDEAIHTALDIIEEAESLYGALPQGRHHCLEHLENFQPADIRRVSALDVVAAVQPMHITLDPGAPENDLGKERVPYMWPFATLLETGATLAFGTDSPVVDVDPRPGLYTAVTRKTVLEGLPEGGWLPSERISAADALRAYTLGSATAANRASDIGTIEKGKFADFAVFDCDLTACDAFDGIGSAEENKPESILDAKTLATYVGGEQVF